MPAMLDDPDSPTIYRVSGATPFPEPGSSDLPSEIVPRQVTLRDGRTAATMMPFASRDQVPKSLLGYLADQLNKEIEGGDTYPMTEPMTHEKFASYWFQNFGALMLLGNIEQPSDLADLPEASTGDWSKTCLGSFYIKPNYPGRSSHVCNAGFLVTDASRGRGVGRLMGECYLDWAPKLGYTYSVFNLVYETNVASCKIWDALGFKRIGRVKGCGDLRSYPGQLVDAIIYGRDLVPGEFPEDLAGVERFDKIKFYLKYNKYPVGADRHEKSRLRSAATHYRLVAGDRLMLKDKEVIPDPRRQYEIARDVHVAAHGGINKTTATIAERYHWSRIKETVSDVIRNCVKCKELGKAPVAANGGSGSSGTARNRAAPADAVSPVSPAAPSGPPSSLSAAPPSAPDELAAIADSAVAAYRYPSPDGGVHPSQTLRDPSVSPLPPTHGHNPMLQDSPRHHDAHAYQPIDPRIIASPHHHGHHHHHHHHEHEHDHDPETDPYAYQTETDFQALLNATAGEDERHAEVDDAAARREAEAVDRDLDMLIEQGDEDETMSGVGRGEDDDVQGPVTLDVTAEEAKVKAIYALSYADG
ncbi:hypothetical protein D7B24_004762 [Verticillium nonalfalfae]|uniref:N-acetyltransferase domain-containing protein n=1 Tax=Verticillium nonalfalfae TaxID=1051616 RepID=A0A3M9XYM4_9PEZI|nr:uncharacterized protein D7B24_004762 [Verticillium nonalfalfae]RNJ51990.1 hypothetical protein D7B24_004762 [Verticillium nonalfalfae]